MIYDSRFTIDEHPAGAARQSSFVNRKSDAARKSSFVNRKSLRAPFPWFGGKSRVAHLVWPRFGDVPNYVAPFCGSLAIELGRPHEPRAETVNDMDCYLANFWRAVQNEPMAVARWADWPVNEADLHARHQWLVNQHEFRERMKTDPDYYDVKIAGWWCWGICQWIGSGWCHHPLRIGDCGLAIADFNPQSGRGIHAGRQTPKGNVWRKRPGLGCGGRGIFGEGLGSQTGVHKLWQQRPNLQAGGNGVHRSVPDISGNSGAFGRGVHRCGLESIYDWFEALQSRLRRVRVCCGDFERVLGPSPTYKIGLTGVFLDPPYSSPRHAELYRTDSMDVAHRAREWAIANGHHPKLRIALCGLEGEHKMPKGWDCVAWKANGGYGNRANGRGRANAGKERIWFSPNCLKG